VYVEIHNNREESYIVTEELVSHITISLYCLIIFFYFTTQNTFLIFNFLFWSGTRTVDFVERERERERGGEIFPSKNSLTRVYPSCICVLRQREWGAPPGS